MLRILMLIKYCYVRIIMVLVLKICFAMVGINLDHRFWFILKSHPCRRWWRRVLKVLIGWLGRGFSRCCSRVLCTTRDHSGFAVVWLVLSVSCIWLFCFILVFFYVLSLFGVEFFNQLSKKNLTTTSNLKLSMQF